MAQEKDSLFTTNTTGDHDNTTAVPEVFDLNLLLQSGPLYFSYHEKVIMLCVVFLIMAVCLTGNGLVMFFTIRDERLHTPILTAIAVHALADVMIAVTWFTQILYTLSVGNTNHFNNYKVACFIERALSVFWFLGQTMNLSVLASERYLYFMFPYWYIRLISVKKIMMAELAIYVLAFIYGICCLILGDSYYSVSLLTCSLYNIPWYFPLTISVWFIPPGLVVIVMVVKLNLLIANQRNQIHVQQTQSHQPTVTTVSKWPTPLDGHIVINEADNGHQKVTENHQDNAGDGHQSTSNTMTVPAGDNDVDDDVEIQGADYKDSIQSPAAAHKISVPRVIRCQEPDSTMTTQNLSTTSSASNNVGQGNTVKIMKTAIKLVGCISLSFFLTYIPGIIVMFKILGETSIIDLELGRYPNQSHLFRIFYFFGVALSTVINPFFHFLFNRPLTRALYKLLGIKVSVEWTDSVT
jgi:hypothetical protein